MLRNLCRFKRKNDADVPNDITFQSPTRTRNTAPVTTTITTADVIRIITNTETTAWPNHEYEEQKQEEEVLQDIAELKATGLEDEDEVGSSDDDSLHFAHDEMNANDDSCNVESIDCVLRWGGWWWWWSSRIAQSAILLIK